MDRPRKQKSFISIVIPAFCEGDGLALAISSIEETLSAIAIENEIIIVDDGSVDDTWAAIKQLHKTYAKLKGIRLSRNFGKEAAIRAGIDAAAGDCVIVMDADLQHPPSLIPEMVRLWRDEGFHIVNAVREKRDVGIRYRVCAALFEQVFGYLTRGLGRGSTDFKLLDRQAVAALLDMKECRTYYRGMVDWLGFRSTELTFEVGPRLHGETKWSFGKLGFLALSAVTSFSAFPLRLLAITGFVFLFFSFAFGVYTILIWSRGHALSGFSTVIILQLITIRVITCGLGIVGEYISAVFDETKGRPRYIIMEATQTVDRNEAVERAETNSP